MALIPRHKARMLFDPAKPVYARRELTIGDKVFKVGDQIPLADLDVALPTAQMWYRVRFIGQEPLDAPKAAPVAAPKPEPVVVAAEPVAETPVVEDEQPKVESKSAKKRWR